MQKLYNFFFSIFFMLSAPFYFLKMWRRGSWRVGFGERFGRYGAKTKQAVTNRQIIWFHAVSVGEVNLCTQLIRALEPHAPGLTILVSTTTSTGMGELHKKLPSHIIKTYYPIDRRAYVRRAFRLFRPKAIVLVEAEIWPNFLWRARELEVPVFLVNARLSDRSYRGYRRFRRLFQPLFGSLAGVGCQNPADADRLKELGCQPEAVCVTGNLKFDAAKLEERRVLDVPGLLRQLGVPPQARLLVAGSTHAGEEAILAEIFLRLKVKFPDVFLVVVPRHFERGREAGQDMAARGLKFTYRSELTQNTLLRSGETEALLVNTTGELRYFYEHASMVFVGKSLTAEGGQNPLEPGALAKPMVFGPNMQNFHAIAKLLVEQEGAVQVRDAQELEQVLTQWLANPERAAVVGQNAARAVKENMGALGRTVDMILARLTETDLKLKVSRERKNSFR